jgi:hypothetical protein
MNVRQPAPRQDQAAIWGTRERRDGALDLDGVAHQFAAIQSAASPLGIDLRPIGVRDAGEIEHGITTLTQSANGGVPGCLITAEVIPAKQKLILNWIRCRSGDPQTEGLQFWDDDDGPELSADEGPLRVRRCTAQLHVTIRYTALRSGC